MLIGHQALQIWTFILVYYQNHQNISNFRHKNLAVVDLEQRKIIGGTTVPHSRANNPDFTQVTTGNLKWLNGLSLDQNQSMMAALATVESSLHIVEWNMEL